jgi:hypothetical protein
MNNCADCGVEKNMMLSTCDILAADTNEVSVMEWVLAEQQGVNKNTGKQNTQLELGLSTLSVANVVKKMVTQLDICRIHQYEYEWRNQMRNRDLIMSHPDLHRVLFTDFGATLDLCAAEKDNSSVNNHAVICIFFVITNWRHVTYKNGGEVDKTILNDCERWIFLEIQCQKERKTITYFTMHALLT